MPLNKGRGFLNQPALVLDRIDSPQRQQHLPAFYLREGRPGLAPAIREITFDRDAMRLDNDALTGVLLAQQRRLFGIAGDDGVGALQHLA